MAQIVRLYPTADGALSWSQPYGGCAHASAGSETGYYPAGGGGPVTSNMFQYVDDPYGSVDETNSFALFSKRDLSVSNEFIAGYAGFTMGPAPSNVSVLSVTLKAYLRASRSAAPDTVGWGTNSPINVYGYVVGTSYTSTAAAIAINTAAAYTRRDSDSPTGSYTLHTLGTWATNPATASAWTQAELVNILAGIRITSMTEAITTASNEHCVELASLYIEATVEPTDAAVENPRKVLSHQLRLKRKPLRKVMVTLPPTFGYLEPGDTVWSAVPTDPLPGEALESQVVDKTADSAKRPLFVTSVETVPAPASVRIEALDFREQSCTYWGTWRTDIGLTADYSGIAVIDRGGGYTMNRAAAATGKDLMRRPNDFYFQEATANKPRFGPYGLMVAGGAFGASRGQAAYTAYTGESSSRVQYGTFSGGSGTTFTGWTNSSAGSGAAINALTTPFVDITGYQRGAQLVAGSTTPDSNYYAMSATAVAGYTSAYRLRVYLGFTAVDDDAAKAATWYIYQNSGGNPTWNPATASWPASAWRQAITVGGATLWRYQSGTGPLHYEYWSDVIAPTGSYTLAMALRSPNVASAYTNWHYAGTLDNAVSTGAGQNPLRRPFVASVGAGVTGYADEYSLYNGSANRIWEALRGFASFQFTPMWDHEDLADGADKYILTAYHDDSNNDYEVLYYHRTNSTTGYYRFQRYYGGADAGYATFATSGDTLPNYMEPVPVAIRWTGTGSELGLASYTLDVFIDGVKGTAAAASNVCRQEGSGTTSDIAPNIYIGHFPKTTTKIPHSFADGYFADFELRDWCPTNQEVALLHDSYTMAGLPTLVS